MLGAISLKKPLQKWVVEQAAARGLKDGNAFVQQVLLEEKKRQAVTRLIQKLEEAEASGSEEWTEHSLEESRQRLRSRLAANKKRTKVK